jgi:LmbE family N-acetylglucosaminyl deacetylase
MEPTPLTLFLSPHFDDIPLSCGGIAARLARMGAHCVGITVFAAPHAEDVPLSPFMQDMHDQWERAAGMTVESINAVRRREEEAAMRLLGLHPEWLDLRDAPYRRGKNVGYFYTSDKGLFGTPAREERVQLAADIANKVQAAARHAQERLGTPGRVRVFAPLGVGRHVDHQLVFLAARRLGPRFGVLFYEDYPYAARPNALDDRLRELGLPARPRVTPISDLIGVKIASIARYKSQLGMLFGSPDAMPQAVRTYTGGVAAEAGWPGEYAERVWQLPPVYSLR